MTKRVSHIGGTVRANLACPGKSQGPGAPGRAKTTAIGAVLCALSAVACPVLAQVEDAGQRAQLPQYQTIPAATEQEQTPTNGLPAADTLQTWTVSHGDPFADRYSALTQINRGNVNLLREAWTYHSGDGMGNIQANPIIVDGVMFGPTPGRAIVAVDASSGAERWRFPLDAVERPRMQDAPARRGLVYWPGKGNHPARIVFGSGDWVYALDPKTGHPIADFGVGGRAPLPTGGTAVGVIWEDTYIVPGLLGDIFGYDVGTGASLWRFHTIPLGAEAGADSWRGAGYNNGAHCWGGLALDAKRGLVYAAIGNATPDFVGVDRLGDNLYSDCIVALDAKSGKLRWYFQNIRHDIWDLDCPAPPVLMSITREGRKIDVVVGLSKLGDTLVLDRVSGKPIFPFRLRRAPTSTLPGEVTAPYQPDPELPEMIAAEDFKLDEVTNRTPQAHNYVMNQLRHATYGWFEPATEGRPLFYAGSRGGAEWTGACVDVPTGRIYLNSNNLIGMFTVYRNDERERDPLLPPSKGELLFQQMCAGCHGPRRQGIGMVPSLIGLRHRLTDEEVTALLKTGRAQMPPAPPMTDDQRRDLLDFLMRRNQPPPPKTATGGPAYFADGWNFPRDQDGYPGCNPPWGLLNCIDLNTGKIVWRVPLGNYEKLSKPGQPETGTENFGGPTVTAGGLVFCSGTKDSMIRAFDADTGAELWSAKLPWTGSAPPSVYQVNGREYVVISATGGGKIETPTGDAYVAFALPSN
jgi:quinoprotein glucose dehydrogenase